MRLYNETNAYHIGLEGFVWFLGVVEDRMDPEKIGRVRVRCFGWHTEDKELVPTETLPWAHIIQPPNLPASYTCKEGDFVFGFFMDGRSGQHPMIVGVLPGKPEKKPDYNAGFSDPNRRYPAKVGESTFSRLATADNKYPYNYVHETESGHTFELDDNGNGRIKLSHNNGTHVEFDEDGNRISVVTKDNIVTITKDNKVTIGGDCTINVEGDCSFSVGGKFSVKAGDISLTADTGSIGIKGLSVSAEATTSMNMKGGTSFVAGSDLRTSISGAIASYGATALLDFPSPIVGIQEGATDGIEGVIIDEAVIPIDDFELPTESGFLDGLNNVIGKVTGAIDNVTDTINQVVSTVEQGITGVIDEVTGGLTTQFREISKQLQPVTDLIDTVKKTEQDLRSAIGEIERSITPVERLIGKELFPKTNFITRALDDFDRFSQKLDAIYDPLTKLNLEVLNINEKLTTKVLDKAYNLNLSELVKDSLNDLNGRTHDLNSYYNLSSKKNRIPHLGGRLAGRIPDYAKYDLEVDFTNYTEYAQFGSEIYKKSRDDYGLKTGGE